MNLRTLVVMSMALSSAHAAHATTTDNFPNRPIRMVVPFVSGGTADTVARIVSDRLWLRLGKPIVIDTRAGANSVVGCEIVAQSNPDGHKIGRAHV